MLLDNLTADQLLNMDFGGGDIKVLLLNLLAFLAGVLMNSFKVMKQEEIGFMEYWTKHGLNSITSLGALAATFVSMMTMAPGAPLYAYFSMAFMGDAMLNKPPVNPVAKNRSLKDELHKLEDKVEGKVDELKAKLEAEHKENPIKTIGLGVAFVLLLIVIL